MNESQRPTMRLGDHLVAIGLISRDQLDIALREQRESREPLGELLVRLGFVAAGDLSRALSESLGHSRVELTGIIPDPEALALVPKPLAQRCVAFPVEFDAAAGIVTVALADTHDVVAIDQINRQLAGRARARFALAAKSEILEAIQRYYSHELTIDGILKELEGGGIDLAALAAAGEDYAHPVVRLANALLSDAVLRAASDIHFEPAPPELRIRYRIDGVLRIIRTLHHSYWPSLLTRLKVMAGMDIAETRAPQDGRISLTVAGHPVDFRCASHPTVQGENYVLRILDRKRNLVGIDGLGLPPDSLALLKLMLERPEGILLVTGPTGSGKTTTLYAVLNHLNQEGVNIMTLEEPVEYPMQLVRQTQVGEAAKIDFASGIRSLMRQDPDIILVGEIRDEETAEMAFRAAMTGHMVFSTLHTNSAVRAFPRLLDIGIRPDVMAGNIIGIIAQRLVRRLCGCATPEAPNERESALFRQAGMEVTQVRRARGCAQCAQTGYKGRLAIMELLRCDDEIDDLVRTGASVSRIESVARKAGFLPMAFDGLRRVAEGVTTLEELGRVVDLTGLILAAEGKTA